MVLAVQLKVMFFTRLIAGAEPDATAAFLSQPDAHILKETASSQGCFLLFTLHFRQQELQRNFDRQHFRFHRACVDCGAKLKKERARSDAGRKV